VSFEEENFLSEMKAIVCLQELLVFIILQIFFSKRKKLGNIAQIFPSLAGAYSVT